MSRDFKLVRELRSWVPRWLWRVCCIGPYQLRLANFWPFQQILTRKVSR